MTHLSNFQFSIGIMDEFEARVERFIKVNIESDDCGIWVDILRLEFDKEDKFCGDDFIKAVSKKYLKNMNMFDKI